MLAVAAALPHLLQGPIKTAIDEIVERRRLAGLSESLATRSAVWRLLHTTFDVVELTERTGADPVEAAGVYWTLFDRLELLWLWDAIGALPRSDRWQTQARNALRDDLLTAIAELTANVLVHPDRTRRRLAGVERALGAASLVAAHRDPAYRRLRHHQPVGGPPPAPQPRPHLRPPRLIRRDAEAR